MYKAIIADDEKIIRTGLKSIIDWESLGFEIQEVFSDGEEIIEYLEYEMPDVILTDIKMVNVSGIDVVKYVSEHKLPCKVILISGFHEFELAVQAIKYGAENYLLKPVNPEELQSVLSTLRKKLDEEKTVREASSQERENMEEMRNILEEQFLEELMLGAVKGQEYIKSRFRIIYPQLDVRKVGCFVFDIKMESFDHFIQNIWEYSYDLFEESLKNLLKVYESDYCFRMIYKNRNMVRILALQCNGKYPKNSQGEVVTYVEAILKELEEVFTLQTSYEIQGIFQNIFELEQHRGRGQNLIEGRSDFQKIQLSEQVHLMVSNVVIGNSSKARQLCHGILEGMREYRPEQRNGEIEKIFGEVCKALSNVNPSLHQLLKSYIREQNILDLPSWEATCEICDRFFDYIRMMSNKRENSADNLVGQAKKYIWDNIYQDVSREEVARKLYICPSYLSKLFLKETGETYLTCVNRMKMDKAIELLKNPENKSYQIGEMLGYATPKYFVRLFKAQTGMTPNEYRRKVLSIGNE